MSTFIMQFNIVSSHFILQWFFPKRDKDLWVLEPEDISNAQVPKKRDSNNHNLDEQRVLQILNQRPSYMQRATAEESGSKGR